MDTFSPCNFALFTPSSRLLPTKRSSITSEVNRRSLFPRAKIGKPQQILHTVFNSLEDLIHKFLDPSLPPSIDPKQVLSGNFSPVDELPPTLCTVVEGALPSALNGAYIRNGPNPHFAPRGPYHCFDGDGMLHAIRMSDGRAIFSSRFVKTYRYKIESEIGAPVVLTLFSAFTNLPAGLSRLVLNHARLITAGYDRRHGVGNANTSLAMIGRKLFALCDFDLPYEVKLTADGDLVTLGRHEDFGSGEHARRMTMTAHPKVDGETSEVFAFRLSVNRPYLTYFRINSEGNKLPEVEIDSMAEATVVHDCAITRNYVIFPDSELVINPKEILKEKPLVAADPGKISRLGIIPRYATEGREMRWVEAPGLNVLHAVNAWEEDGGQKIVMIAPNLTPIELVLTHADLVRADMERIEIDLKAETVVRRRIASGNLELGVINPSYVGRKNRFMYAAVGTLTRIEGVVKLDLSKKSGDCTVARRIYGQGCYGGEPCFVAREKDNPAAAEDEGYLVSYVHNEMDGESRFIVMDAKSPELEIVAAVRLPQRVPCGFHGIFVREDDLKKL